MGTLSLTIARGKGFASGVLRHKIDKKGEVAGREKERAQIDNPEGWLILSRRYCPSTAKPETNCLYLTVYEFLSRLATD
jgi:hypothetical protein